MSGCTAWWSTPCYLFQQFQSSFLSYFFTQLRKDLMVVMVINRLIFRNIVKVHNPTNNILSCAGRPGRTSYLMFLWSAWKHLNHSKNRIHYKHSLPYTSKKYFCRIILYFITSWDSITTFPDKKRKFSFIDSSFKILSIFSAKH